MNAHALAWALLIRVQAYQCLDNGKLRPTLFFAYSQLTPILRTKKREYMELFEMHAEFYNKPIRLTKEQCEQPFEVINQFFHGHHLFEIRQLLWDWLEVSITTSNAIFDESSERDRIVCFYKSLEAFIEAVHILHLQNETLIRQEHTKRIVG